MKRFRFSSWRSSTLCSLLVALCTSASAMFMMPQPAPVSRLLAKAEEYLAKHPASAEAHYTLARIHYLAFHLKREEVPAFSNDEKADRPPKLAPQWMVGGGAEKKQAKAPPDKVLADHAARAMRGFSEALRIDPKNALTQLGIASLMEEFTLWSKTAKPAELPPGLDGITISKARAAYSKAMALALPEESKLKEQPLPGIQSLTSHEAASALVRLADDKGERLTAAESDDVKKAKQALEHFKTLHMGAVTPMVFSFQPADHLDALLAAGTATDFDLRGYGPRGRWPWVKPELGLLVWDPEHSGIIRSARQLFGGYTFEIFRANGYDALAALDDDGEGALTGEELDGISVWFDRDGDGISGPAEVKAVRDLGIVSIAVTMDGHDGIHPTNPRGITLHDGRTLRTWDWIVEPLKELPASPTLD